MLLLSPCVFGAPGSANDEPPPLVFQAAEADFLQGVLRIPDRIHSPSPDLVDYVVSFQLTHLTPEIRRNAVAKFLVALGNVNDRWTLMLLMKQNEAKVGFHLEEPEWETLRRLYAQGARIDFETLVKGRPRVSESLAYRHLFRALWLALKVSAKEKLPAPEGFEIPFGWTQPKSSEKRPVAARKPKTSKTVPAEMHFEGEEKARATDFIRLADTQQDIGAFLSELKKKAWWTGNRGESSEAHENAVLDTIVRILRQIAFLNEAPESGETFLSRIRTEIDDSLKPEETETFRRIFAPGNCPSIGDLLKGRLVSRDDVVVHLLRAYLDAAALYRGDEAIEWARRLPKPRRESPKLRADTVPLASVGGAAVLCDSRLPRQLQARLSQTIADDHFQKNVIGKLGISPENIAFYSVRSLSRWPFAGLYLITVGVKKGRLIESRSIVHQVVEIASGRLGPTPARFRDGLERIVGPETFLAGMDAQIQKGKTKTNARLLFFDAGADVKPLEAWTQRSGTAAAKELGPMEDFEQLGPGRYVRSRDRDVARHVEHILQDAGAVDPEFTRQQVLLGFDGKNVSLHIIPKIQEGAVGPPAILRHLRALEDALYPGDPERFDRILLPILAHHNPDLVWMWLVHVEGTTLSRGIRAYFPDVPSEGIPWFPPSREREQARRRFENARKLVAQTGDRLGGRRNYCFDEESRPVSKIARYVNVMVGNDPAARDLAHFLLQMYLNDHRMNPEVLSAARAALAGERRLDRTHSSKTRSYLESLLKLVTKHESVRRPEWATDKEVGAFGRKLVERGRQTERVIVNVTTGFTAEEPLLNLARERGHLRLKLVFPASSGAVKRALFFEYAARAASWVNDPQAIETAQKLGVFSPEDVKQSLNAGRVTRENGHAIYRANHAEIKALEAALDWGNLPEDDPKRTEYKRRLEQAHANDERLFDVLTSLERSAGNPKSEGLTSLGVGAQVSDAAPEEGAWNALESAARALGADVAEVPVGDNRLTPEGRPQWTFGNGRWTLYWPEGSRNRNEILQEYVHARQIREVPRAGEAEKLRQADAWKRRLELQSIRLARRFGRKAVSPEVFRTIDTEVREGARVENWNGTVDAALAAPAVKSALTPESKAAVFRAFLRAFAERPDSGDRGILEHVQRRFPWVTDAAARRILDEHLKRLILENGAERIGLSILSADRFSNEGEAKGRLTHYLDLRDPPGSDEVTPEHLIRWLRAVAYTVSERHRKPGEAGENVRMLKEFRDDVPVEMRNPGDLIPSEKFVIVRFRAPRSRTMVEFRGAIDVFTRSVILQSVDAAAFGRVLENLDLKRADVNLVRVFRSPDGLQRISPLTMSIETRAGSTPVAVDLKTRTLTLERGFETMLAAGAEKLMIESVRSQGDHFRERYNVMPLTFGTGSERTEVVVAFDKINPGLVPLSSLRADQGRYRNALARALLVYARSLAVNPDWAHVEFDPTGILVASDPRGSDVVFTQISRVETAEDPIARLVDIKRTVAPFRDDPAWFLRTVPGGRDALRSLLLDVEERIRSGDKRGNLAAMHETLLARMRELGTGVGDRLDFYVSFFRGSSEYDRAKAVAALSAWLEKQPSKSGILQRLNDAVKDPGLNANARQNLSTIRNRMSRKGAGSVRLEELIGTLPERVRKRLARIHQLAIDGAPELWDELAEIQVEEARDRPKEFFEILRRSEFARDLVPLALVYESGLSRDPADLKAYEALTEVLADMSPEVDGLVNLFSRKALQNEKGEPLVGPALAGQRAVRRRMSYASFIRGKDETLRDLALRGLRGWRHTEEYREYIKKPARTVKKPGRSPEAAPQAVPAGERVASANDIREVMQGKEGLAATRLAMPQFGFRKASDADLAELKGSLNTESRLMNGPSVRIRRITPMDPEWTTARGKDDLARTVLVLEKDAPVVSGSFFEDGEGIEMATVRQELAILKHAVHYPRAFRWISHWDAETPRQIGDRIFKRPPPRDLLQLAMLNHAKKEAIEGRLTFMKKAKEGPIVPYQQQKDLAEANHRQLTGRLPFIHGMDRVWVAVEKVLSALPETATQEECDRAVGDAVEGWIQRRTIKEPRRRTARPPSEEAAPAERPSEAPETAPDPRDGTASAVDAERVERWKNSRASTEDPDRLKRFTERAGSKEGLGNGSPAEPAQVPEPAVRENPRPASDKPARPPLRPPGSRAVSPGAKRLLAAGYSAAHTTWLIAWMEIAERVKAEAREKGWDLRRLSPGQLAPMFAGAAGRFWMDPASHAGLLGQWVSEVPARMILKDPAKLAGFKALLAQQAMSFIGYAGWSFFQTVVEDLAGDNPRLRDVRNIFGDSAVRAEFAARLSAYIRSGRFSESLDSAARNKILTGDAFFFLSLSQIGGRGGAWIGTLIEGALLGTNAGSKAGPWGAVLGLLGGTAGAVGSVFLPDRYKSPITDVLANIPEIEAAGHLSQARLGVAQWVRSPRPVRDLPKMLAEEEKQLGRTLNPILALYQRNLGLLHENPANSTYVRKVGAAVEKVAKILDEEIQTLRTFEESSGHPATKAALAVSEARAVYARVTLEEILHSDASVALYIVQPLTLHGFSMERLVNGMVGLQKAALERMTTH